MPTPDPTTPPPAQPAARKHVFISYSCANKAFVVNHIADLQAAGVIVWIDQSGLQPGVGNWEAVLRINDDERVKPRALAMMRSDYPCDKNREEVPHD